MPTKIVQLKNLFGACYVKNEERWQRKTLFSLAINVLFLRLTVYENDSTCDFWRPYLKLNSVRSNVSSLLLFEKLVSSRTNNSFNKKQINLR